MVKKILLAVFVVMCCGAVLVGGAWCSAQKDDSSCTAVQIVVRDSMQRQFVQADLRRYHLLLEWFCTAVPPDPYQHH